MHSTHHHSYKISALKLEVIAHVMRIIDNKKKKEPFPEVLCLQMSLMSPFS